MILILLLLQIIRTDKISAIQEAYPFKIDYVLLVLDNVYLDSLPATQSIDPGIHHITFVQSMPTIPDNILVSIPKFWKTQYNSLSYYFQTGNITSTGFTIQTSFSQANVTIVLFSYLTIINGFGIQIIDLYFGSLSHTSSTTYNAEFDTTLFLEPSSGPPNKASHEIIPIPKAISISNFNPANPISIIVYRYTDYRIRMDITIPSSSVLTNYSASILVFQQSVFISTSSIFGGYSFEIRYYYNATQIMTSIFQTNNVSSYIYFMSGLISGGFGKTSNLATTIKVPFYPDPAPSSYNSLYLLQRNYSLNKVSINADSPSSSKFFSILIYRKQCADPYPFLMMNTQQCYDKCPEKYYNDSNGRCNKCQDCTDITQCDYCYQSMCDQDQYYYPNTHSCIKCTTIDSDCQTCFKGVCTNCSIVSNKVLISGICESCNDTFYYDNGTCVSCSGSNQCSNCQNLSYCDSCAFPYKLTIGNTCLDCQFPYLLTSSNLCNNCSYPYKYQNGDCNQCYSPYRMDHLNKCQECEYPHFYLGGSCLNCYDPFKLLGIECVTDELFSFTMKAYSPLWKSNLITVYLDFEDNISLIRQRYSYRWTLQQQIIQPTLIYFANNTLKAEIDVSKSIKSPTIKVQFFLQKLNNVLSKTEDESSIADIYVVSPFEAQVYDTISDVLEGIADSSGALVSSFSLSSMLSYMVGILWSFQIASYYLFLPIYKPKNLLMFLNATIQMQDIQLLPFELPNVFGQKDEQVKGAQVYKQYGVDLYFLRSNYEEIISMVIFALFYILLYWIFVKIQSKYCLIKFIRSQLVDKLYSNVSLNFYSVITVMTFTASATLSTLNFETFQLQINYFTAVMAIFIMFLFSVIHPTLLYYWKQKQQWDTQDCYVGLNRQKNYSETYLSMYLISQLIIPLAIPLFHPMFAIAAILTSSLWNLIFLMRIRTVKIYICIYYRIAGQIGFIVFNILFVVYYVIDNYFPYFNIELLHNLGFISISSISLVMIVQVIEMITQIIVDSIRFIKRMIMNVKITQLVTKQNTKDMPNQKKIKKSIRKKNKSKEGKTKKRPYQKSSNANMQQVNQNTYSNFSAQPKCKKRVGSQLSAPQELAILQKYIANDCKETDSEMRLNRVSMQDDSEQSKMRWQRQKRKRVTLSQYLANANYQFRKKKQRI